MAGDMALLIQMQCGGLDCTDTDATAMALPAGPPRVIWIQSAPAGWGIRVRAGGRGHLGPVSFAGAVPQYTYVQANPAVQITPGAASR